MEISNYNKLKKIIQEANPEIMTKEKNNKGMEKVIIQVIQEIWQSVYWS